MTDRFLTRGCQHIMNVRSHLIINVL
jgi:hypothetical protein